MTIELILWILVGLLISEIIFILQCRRCPGNWVGDKIGSLWLAIIFMLVQVIVVRPKFVGYSGEANYFNLVYEAGVIVFFVILFYLNKQLAKQIS